MKVARARVDFPTVIGAIDHGELSVEHVAVAVTAPAWADDQIIDMVRISTVDKLRRQMRERNFDADPEEQSNDATPKTSQRRTSLQQGETSPSWGFAKVTPTAVQS